MFLWKCFVSETVVILYARRSRSTIFIVKCGCTVHEKYIYISCKFVLYVDIPVFSLSFFSFFHFVSFFFAVEQ